MENIFKATDLTSYRKDFIRDIEDLDSSQMAPVIARLMYLLELDFNHIMVVCADRAPQEYVHDRNYIGYVSSILRTLNILDQLSVNENESVGGKCRAYWEDVKNRLGQPIPKEGSE